jgi:hypothetical protein
MKWLKIMLIILSVLISLYCLVLLAYPFLLAFEFIWEIIIYIYDITF